MSHPDPFVPPSGAAAPDGDATSRPRPAYGAYAPAPGADGKSELGGFPQVGATSGVERPTPAVPSVLAGWTVGLAVAWTAVQALLFVTSFEAARAYAQAAAAGIGAADVLTTYDSVVMLLLPVQVATFVVGGLWLFRSRELAAVLQPREPHQRRPVWVWLGWVVPFVALWFPYQVVRDVRRGTTRSYDNSGLRRWWACWLVMIWSTNQAGLASLGLGVFDLYSLPYLEGVAAAAAVVGAVYWIRIVREITSAQRSHSQTTSIA